jgi:hypothetical protein
VPFLEIDAATVRMMADMAVEAIDNVDRRLVSMMADDNVRVADRDGAGLPAVRDGEQNGRLE